MAMTRMTLAEAKALGRESDAARVAATDEAEIRRHMIEDGQDPDEVLPVDAVGRLPGTVRR
jgi:putative transcriptional regulator